MVKKASSTVYPLNALRTMVLHIQHRAMPNDASPTPTPGAIVDLVKALGYVQIDTLNVINRAHYVALWARFGSYILDDFHKLIYSGSEPAKDQRRLYEGWGHAASSIPLEHYRYHDIHVSLLCHPACT